MGTVKLLFTVGTALNVMYYCFCSLHKFSLFLLLSISIFLTGFTIMTVINVISLFAFFNLNLFWFHINVQLRYMYVKVPYRYRCKQICLY